MNIYQLCGPQDHDDNDNITTGASQLYTKKVKHITCNVYSVQCTMYAEYYSPLPAGDNHSPANGCCLAGLS